MLVHLFSDFLRYSVFVFSGVSVGFMIMTNVIAYKVLRPPKQLGFLWWHVTSISLGTCLIGSVALDNLIGRIGEPFSWRAPIMFAGSGLIALAQLLIFKVERSRLITKKAQEIVARAT